jgi:hypothetical protein
MSINPVSTIDATSAAQFADASPQKRASATPGASSVRPDPGTLPKQKEVSAQPAAASTEVGQDEVQVQRDQETNGEVVIRYLDHSGNLIVQVPSSQMLGVTRTIDQDFQARAKVRENEAAVPPNNAGGNHGR